MSVKNQHKSYRENLQRWDLIDDVVGGQRAVKSRRELYLPIGGCNDRSEQNLIRYDGFLQRAVFVEYTKETLQNFTALAFAEDPIFDADGLDFLKSDADGAGKSIYQLNQEALSQILKHDQAGFLVDYPQMSQDVSIAEAQQKGIRTTVVLYDAKSIINWRVDKIGGVFKTTLVVLAETVSAQDPSDEFLTVDKAQYRVLRLDDGGYSVQFYDENEVPVSEPFYPLASGRRLDFIPFQPLGAFVNDFNVGQIPLESLAEMNLAHYRNSAEYENAVYYCGQVQPYITDLDEDWRDHLEKSGVRFGSGEVMMLPAGGKLGFAQADPNTLAKEAMDDKAKIMQSLGAKVLEPSQQVKTATQSDNEKQTQNSILSLCVANLNEAAESVLKWVALFEGRGKNALFNIKQDFAISKVGLEELKFYYELVIGGQLSKQTFHKIRTTGKMPELSYDDEQLLIEAERDGVSLQV